MSPEVALGHEIPFAVNREPLERIGRSLRIIDAAQKAVIGFDPNCIYSQLSNKVDFFLMSDSPESPTIEVELSSEEIHAIGAFLVGFPIEQHFPNSPQFKELLDNQAYDSVAIDLPWAEYLPDLLHIVKQFLAKGGEDPKGYMPFLQRVVDRK